MLILMILKTHKIYPRRVTLTETWSLRQLLDKEDLLSLRKDLLLLFMSLQSKDSKPSGIMKISNSTILDTISNDILINLGND